MGEALEKYLYSHDYEFRVNVIKRDLTNFALEKLRLRSAGSYRMFTLSGVEG